MTARNTFSRWDYCDDRLDFTRWVKAKRPCGHLDWQWDGERLVVKVQPDMGHRRWYNLTGIELDYFRGGWRALVALAIRDCRKWIRREREKEHHAAMADFRRDRIGTIRSDFGEVHFIRHHV